jgi:hypothetical protein
MNVALIGPKWFGAMRPSVRPHARSVPSVCTSIKDLLPDGAFRSPPIEIHGIPGARRVLDPGFGLGEPYPVQLTKIVRTFSNPHSRTALQTRQHCRERRTRSNSWSFNP